MFGIVDYQEIVKERDGEIANLKLIITSKDKGLTDAKHTIISKDNDITNLKSQLISNDSEIVKLKDKITKLRQLKPIPKNYDKNKIFQYIKDDDIDAVSYCIDNGMFEVKLTKDNVPLGYSSISDYSMRYDDYWLCFNSSSLIVTSFFGKINIVKMLIDRGANVNEQDGNGITALMEASYNSRIETVRLLINRGANVNEKDNNESTALMFASDSGNIEIVKLLIDSNAEINERDNYGNTALYLH